MEIGVAGGATSKYLLDTHLNATLYACDPFEAYFDKPTRDHDKTLKIYEKRMKNHIDSGRLKFERKSSFKYLVERILDNKSLNLRISSVPGELNFLAD